MNTTRRKRCQWLAFFAFAYQILCFAAADPMYHSRPPFHFAPTAASPGTHIPANDGRAINAASYGGFSPHQGYLIVETQQPALFPVLSHEVVPVYTYHPAVFVRHDLVPAPPQSAMQAPQVQFYPTQTQTHRRTGGSVNPSSAPRQRSSVIQEFGDATSKQQQSQGNPSPNAAVDQPQNAALCLSGSKKAAPNLAAPSASKSVKLPSEASAACLESNLNAREGVAIKSLPNLGVKILQKVPDQKSIDSKADPSLTGTVSRERKDEESIVLIKATSSARKDGSRLAEIGKDHEYDNSNHKNGEGKKLNSPKITTSDTHHPGSLPVQVESAKSQVKPSDNGLKSDSSHAELRAPKTQNIESMSIKENQSEISAASPESKSPFPSDKNSSKRKGKLVESTGFEKSFVLGAEHVGSVQKSYKSALQDFTLASPGYSKNRSNRQAFTPNRNNQAHDDSPAVVRVVNTPEKKVPGSQASVPGSQASASGSRSSSSGSQQSAPESDPSAAGSYLSAVGSQSSISGSQSSTPGSEASIATGKSCSEPVTGVEVQSQTKKHSTHDADQISDSDVEPQSFLHQPSLTSSQKSTETPVVDSLGHKSDNSIRNHRSKKKNSSSDLIAEESEENSESSGHNANPGGSGDEQTDTQKRPHLEILERPRKSYRKSTAKNKPKKKKDKKKKSSPKLSSVVSTPLDENSDQEILEHNGYDPKIMPHKQIPQSHKPKFSANNHVIEKLTRVQLQWAFRPGILNHLPEDEVFPGIKKSSNEDLIEYQILKKIYKLWPQEWVKEWKTNELDLHLMNTLARHLRIFDFSDHIPLQDMNEKTYRVLKLKWEQDSVAFMKCRFWFQLKLGKFEARRRDQIMIKQISERTILENWKLIKQSLTTTEKLSISDAELLESFYKLSTYFPNPLEEYEPNPIKPSAESIKQIQDHLEKSLLVFRSNRHKGLAITADHLGIEKGKIFQEIYDRSRYNGLDIWKVEKLIQILNSNSKKNLEKSADTENVTEQLINMITAKDSLIPWPESPENFWAIQNFAKEYESLLEKIPKYCESKNKNPNI